MGLTIFASQLVARIIAETVQVQKTTDILVNYVSIYKIFRESATNATRADRGAVVIETHVCIAHSCHLCSSLRSATNPSYLTENLK